MKQLDIDVSPTVNTSIMTMRPLTLAHVTFVNFLSGEPFS